MSDNDYCMIKSMKDGINLYLDPDAPFVELCTSVCRKFAESRDFFGEVAIPIMFSGRVISEEEMKGICECIELNSMVRITLVIDEDLNLVKDRRMLELSDRFFSESILENAKIVKDSVKPGRDLHSDSSILILGCKRKCSCRSCRKHHSDGGSKRQLSCRDKGREGGFCFGPLL